ncbi:MAG: hypothetical protein IMF19_06685 [Proteobacteria bacterium]|nr:hypothetical protein [Pseudomonadota bacterium]
MCIRSTSDILPKWWDIQSSYILSNWDDIRSIADIPKLGEIAPWKPGVCDVKLT